jgi:hypothetical protein
MYERMKAFLHHCINVVLAVILLGGCAAYVAITSVLMTGVINDLRLDTYVNFDTGFAIVMLILFLAWGPVWVMRSMPSTGRYVGKL